MVNYNDPEFPQYQTIAGALLTSKEWKSWLGVAHEHGYDAWETNDTGWMSDGHWEAFLKYCKSI